MIGSNGFVCTTCRKSYPLDAQNWLCSCGSLLEFEYWPPFDRAQIDASRSGLWRYHRLLPLDPAWEPVSLGEGGTPLIPLEWTGQAVLFKMESMNPTGSFKDRGASVLVSALRGLGITEAVEDSSGNAGASLAAYAARAGIACEICVPSTASGPKLAQMAACGAEVIQIKGKREYAALAAWAAAAHGAYYASHVLNPFFAAGTETVACELWEQLDHRAPGAVVLPVGNGSLLLGVYDGFSRLHQAGLIARLPRLLAVQAAACAPLYHAFHEGLAGVASVPCGPTVASGIAIAQPPRGEQILAAIRATDGTVVCLAEDEILEAHRLLARRGFYVEETSAVAVAALAPLAEMSLPASVDPVVVLLTGHGLKTIDLA
jgi:threonine synthase